MAKVTLGPVIGQASGRIGALVFSHNRGGAYIRNGSIPVTSTTAPALAAKARLSAATAAFRDLTATQRLSWDEYGRENPITDRLGKSVTLTGHQIYVGIRSRLVLAAETPIDVPPIVPAPPAVLTSALTGDIGAGTSEIAWTPTPLAADEALWVQAALVNSAAITYVENYKRFITVEAAASASPYDWLLDVVAVFGGVAVGQTLHTFTSVFSRTTGLLSQPVRNQVVLTST